MSWINKYKSFASDIGTLIEMEEHQGMHEELDDLGDVLRKLANVGVDFIFTDSLKESVHEKMLRMYEAEAGPTDKDIGEVLELVNQAKKPKNADWSEAELAGVKNAQAALQDTLNAYKHNALPAPKSLCQMKEQLEKRRNEIDPRREQIR